MPGTPSAPPLPSVWETQAWAEPATPAAAAALATYAVTAVEGDTAPGRVEIVAHALNRRGYTLAEMHLIAEELLFVPAYYGRVNLPRLDEIVNEHREIRSALAPVDGRARVLSDFDLERLLSKFPMHVHRDQFGRCGYDSKGGSRWIALSPDGTKRRDVPPPAPEGVPLPQLAPATWLPTDGPSGEAR